MCATHISASCCNVYFMLCWSSLHVESRQPSNIHTTEPHFHIKGPPLSRTDLDEYLRFSVLLSLTPYVLCLLLALCISRTPCFVLIPLLKDSVFSLMSITFPDYSHENKGPQMFQALNGPKPGCCRFPIEQIVQTSHRCSSTAGACYPHL